MKIQIYLMHIESLEIFKKIRKKKFFSLYF